MLLFIFTGLLFAQKKEETEKEKAEKLKLQQDVLHYKELETKLLEEAFEQAIDPEKYIVGPGDYFSITLFDNIQERLDILVTPEGMLIIPKIGSIKVDKLTLDRTKSLVKKAALKKYKLSKISVSLIKLRKIRVHVTGKVLTPGTFVVTPIDRVSDLISRAGGLSHFAYVQDLIIKHINSKETHIDYSLFQVNGDLSQNPLLCGGDIIVVPTIDYSKMLVKVEGNLRSPGFYSLKNNEYLSDFLNRHNLLRNSQQIKKVNIKRANGGNIIVDLTESEKHQTILKNGDILILPIDVQYIYVSGAVQKPGQYPYIMNLQAKDYVGRAGMTDNAASINSIKIRHAATGIVEKGGNTRVFAGDIVEVPLRTSKRLSEYLQLAGQIATIIIAIVAIQK